MQLQRHTALLLLLLAAPVSAHAPVPSRALRLQLADGRLQGLLEFHLPAAAAAVYAAAQDPAVALVPAAAAGLRIEADGAAAQPKVQDARAERRPDGAIDERILLDAGPAARSLRIFVEAGPPLPIELIAASGVRLKLASGPGAAIPGGLALRPRPGAPCTITIVR